MTEFDWANEENLENGIYQARILGGAVVEGRYGRQLEVRIELLARLDAGNVVVLERPVERRLWITLRPRALERAREAGVVRRREDGRGEILIGAVIAVLVTEKRVKLL